MKKITRLVSALLLVAAIFSLFSTVAFAATSKRGTNLVVTVETSKRPWYSPLKATVKVTNTGSSAMDILVEDANGRLVKNIRLNAGKTTTIRLNCNTVYTISWAGNYLQGNPNAVGKIEAGRYIKNIY